VRTLGVEPVDPVQGLDLDVLASRHGPSRQISSFLNDPTVVSASA
jgi:hypothetical protein